MITITRELALQAIQNRTLIANETYLISDKRITLVAKSVDRFFPIPLQRTVQGLNYDKEEYDIKANQLLVMQEMQGVVRCTNQVWSFINDIGHSPRNFGTIVNLPESGFKIQFIETYTKVIGFQLSLDETYSKSNLCISTGVSVGFAQAIVLTFKTVIQNGLLTRIPLTHAEASIPSSNIWVSGLLAKSITL